MLIPSIPGHASTASPSLAMLLHLNSSSAEELEPELEPELELELPVGRLARWQWTNMSSAYSYPPLPSAFGRHLPLILAPK